MISLSIKNWANNYKCTLRRIEIKKKKSYYNFRFFKFLLASLFPVKYQTFEPTGFMERKRKGFIWEAGSHLESVYIYCGL